jgi:adenylosuccinate lyase
LIFNPSSLKNVLTSISPVDGRYAAQTAALQQYFSEFALIRYRLWVEVKYFVALCRLPLPQLSGISQDALDELERIPDRYSLEDAAQIKATERVTNHDVKAVEYFLKEKFAGLGLAEYAEFVHFGLTSQDINNTAVPLMLRDALADVYLPVLHSLMEVLGRQAQAWSAVPMLARTHGQPASPTRLGKEMAVFLSRLEGQLQLLQDIPHRAKFGGATGNFNAHAVAFPETDWHAFATQFVASLGLERTAPTTQIEPYDHLAAQCHALMRINTILIGFCRDIWTYISMEYFRQHTVEGEVGSSAMPHKVNPIDFENAEGNLGIANALFAHFADKLPISRLQRDLTDSTVLRNLGVPLAHSLIALQSLLKGMDKIVLNAARLQEDLGANWMVVAEGIQTILRREGYPQPYEALKALTRGKAHIGQEELHAFIGTLAVPMSVKVSLKALTPFNYTGQP